MVETYGNQSLISKIPQMLKVKSGYLELKERTRLDKFDKNEEEE